MASAAVFIADPKQSQERVQHESVAPREESIKQQCARRSSERLPRWKRVLSLVSKGRSQDATVLVTGRNRDSKELVARAVHRGFSDLTSFVCVNCARPRDLIASELFGHERALFRSVAAALAVSNWRGRHDLPRRSRELPLGPQIALLAFLQEREFERVGEPAPSVPTYG